MGLDQFKQADRLYKFDGGDFDTAGDMLQTGMLGFCGCGDPDSNRESIRRGLEIIAEPYPKNENWKAWIKIHNASVIEHFGNDQSAYFFYYWADKNRLTEHGGCIPGWLDDRGKELLRLLNEEKQIGGQ